MPKYAVGMVPVSEPIVEAHLVKFIDADDAEGACKIAFPEVCESVLESADEYFSLPTYIADLFLDDDNRLVLIELP